MRILILIVVVVVNVVVVVEIWGRNPWLPPIEHSHYVNCLSSPSYSYFSVPVVQKRWKCIKLSLRHVKGF